MDLSELNVCTVCFPFNMPTLLTAATHNPPGGFDLLSVCHISILVQQVVSCSSVQGNCDQDVSEEQPQMDKKKTIKII